MNAALRHVFVASLMGRRLATGLSLLAIALGVALGLAVQLIHRAALDEFGRGMRLVAGEADLQIVGPRSGFDDALYALLAQRPEVADAAPVLEVEARLRGSDETLRIYGLDALRAARMQPALLPVPSDGARRGEAGALADDRREGREPAEDDRREGEVLADDRREFEILAADALFLSPAARAVLGVADGGTVDVVAGTRVVRLRVAGGVAGAGRGQQFAVMDIAAVQQTFGRVGQLTRVDLRLVPGLDVEAARRGLAALLPAGVAPIAPRTAELQVAGLSQAYRVNLTMLAAIALLTGGFLVFSTQLLSVVRRHREIAFLRALGLERRTLLRGLLVEGGVLGLAGGGLGVALGYLLGALAVAAVGGDLGAGYFEGVAPALHFAPGVSAVYLLLGVVAGLVGAWLPAREATRIAPARALHAGGDVELLRVRAHWRVAAALLCAAALACLLPPIGGVPVFGYAAIALILAGSVLLLPPVVRLATRAPEPARALLLRLAHARLAGAPGQVVVAGAGVVASVALAGAMAIMVASFRDSVDEWLSVVLPADLYLRASTSAASGFLSPDAVAVVAATDGVASVQPLRFDSLRLDASGAPVTLVARPVAGGNAVPLVGPVAPAPPGERPVWVSEAAADLYGFAPGGQLSLPLGGRWHRFHVAGVWRDYARQHGAVLIELADYRRFTNDVKVNDLAIRLAASADADGVAAALRRSFDEGAVDIVAAGEIRSKTLAIFDRTFFVTYLMEAVAVLIGLFGVATTFAALATARRKEFGMLRHLGLARREIGRLLALEGALGAALGVAVGMVAAGAIAFVLVEVVNRQSFHWSMELHVPYAALAAFGGALVLLAAGAARLAGARAMQQSAVVAVREDW